MHFRIERSTGSMVRLKRTGDVTRTREELEAELSFVRRELPPARRGNVDLLLDLREVPLGHGDVFEMALRAYQGEMLDGFRRVAVLVQTAVGRLQVLRHQRESARERPVFLSEGEAIDYLAGKGKAPAPAK